MKKFHIANVSLCSAILVGVFYCACAQAAPITSPTEIPGTKLWLDGNDVDGDGIAEGAGENFTPGGTTTWIDKSAAGTNHATQATGNLQPVVAPGALNSKAVVRFDGGNISSAGEGDYLNLPNFASGFTQATGIIVFTANGNAVNPSNSRNGGAWNFGTNSSNNHFGGTTADLYDDFGIGTRPYIEPGIPTGTSTPMLYAALVTGTQFFPYVNGVLGSASAFPLAATPSWNTSPTIGVNTATRYNGDVAEVIIFDRILSDGSVSIYDNEYNDVMFYLQEKWNLGLGFSATPLEPPPVPEPASLLLVGLGWGLIQLRRRKRARRA